MIHVNEERKPSLKCIKLSIKAALVNDGLQSGSLKQGMVSKTFNDSSLIGMLSLKLPLR